MVVGLSRIEDVRNCGSPKRIHTHTHTYIHVGNNRSLRPHNISCVCIEGREPIQEKATAFGEKENGAVRTAPGCFPVSFVRRNVHLNVDDECAIGVRIFRFGKSFLDLFVEKHDIRSRLIACNCRR